jgi:hypothetical protein
MLDTGNSTNLAQGNFIGTDISGGRALGNNLNGFVITQAPGSVIGGLVIGARNYISANSRNGIAVGTPVNDLEGNEVLGGTGVTVQGNFIGTDVTGKLPLGNQLNGILFDANTSDNQVKGGTDIGEVGQNLIAFNGRNGISIPNVPTGNPGIRISLLGNSIYSNSALSIDLGDPGETPNDDKDNDTGANELQNFPTLTRVSFPAMAYVGTMRIAPSAVATINGTFNSAPNSTFVLEFFLASACQTEGPQVIDLIPVFLGQRRIDTDSEGNAAFSFEFNFPDGVGAGFVNATATSLSGNTSEYSQCISVVNPSAPRITGQPQRSGKKLIITGENFSNGAKILINGSEQKTIYESATRLVGKKAGKKIKAGDKVRVRNSDGTSSNEVTYSP